jgi:hypothetical protein
MRMHGKHSKDTITIKTRPAGYFPPASQACRLVGPVFYVYVFSLGQPLVDLPGGRNYRQLTQKTLFKINFLRYCRFAWKAPRKKELFKVFVLHQQFCKTFPSF